MAVGGRGDQNRLSVNAVSANSHGMPNRLCGVAGSMDHRKARTHFSTQIHKDPPALFCHVRDSRSNIEPNYAEATRTHLVLGARAPLPATPMMREG